LGWYGSESLDKCLADTPCGCDLLDKADKQVDQRAFKAFKKEGEIYRQKWQCEFSDDKNTDVFDAQCSKTLKKVEKLTGAQGLTKCPGWYLRQNWMLEIVEAQRWYKTSQLALLCPNPSGTLTSALGCLNSALTAREAHELEQIRQPKTETKQQPFVVKSK
jgi:hypothetical protein